MFDDLAQPVLSLRCQSGFCGAKAPENKRRRRCLSAHGGEIKAEVVVVGGPHGDTQRFEVYTSLTSALVDVMVVAPSAGNTLKKVHRFIIQPNS